MFLEKLKSLKNLVNAKLKSVHDKGLRLPFARDAVTGKPSVTLLYSYVTFILSVASIVLLHYNSNLFIATFTTLGFWTLATIFYLIRSLNKAKVDFDDKSIELDGGEEKNEQ